jgi:hypothetical protein
MVCRTITQKLFSASFFSGSGVAWLLIGGVLAGCAHEPLIRSPVAENSRVGMVFHGFPDQMTHVYVGTTIFNNATNDYPLLKPMQPFVEQRLERELRRAGMIPVALDLSLQQREALENSFVPRQWDGNLVASPDAEQVITEITKTYDLDLIIRVWSREGTVMLSDVSHPSGHYGPFTFSFLGSNRHMAYSNICMHAYLASPARTNSRGCQLANPKIEHLVPPADPKNPDRFYRQGIEAYIRNWTAELIKAGVQDAMGEAIPKQELIYFRP